MIEKLKNDLLQPDVLKDLEKLEQIPIIEQLLRVICETTGMGFATVVKVTEDRWIAAKVIDEIDFGIEPGDELPIHTTICNEVRLHETPVIIDDVKQDPEYKHHQTPQLYGFRSFISVPIHRRDGDFFGTICVFDPKPNNLKTPTVQTMFSLFADLISLHLYTLEEVTISRKTLKLERELHKKVEESQSLINAELEKKVAERTQDLREKNAELEYKNMELKSFTYISSHDLQEPLRKLQIMSSYIRTKAADNLPAKANLYLERISQSAARMQELIKDLLAYSDTQFSDRHFEELDLYKPVSAVLAEYHHQLKQSRAQIEIGEMVKAKVIPSQLQHLLINLVDNAIKFSHPDRPLILEISSLKGKGIIFDFEALDPDKTYSVLFIEDNGIGIDPVNSGRIFKIFQKIPQKEGTAGTGIGLAIVKRIMENHRGEVNVHSKKEGGTIFELYFPD